MPLLCEEFERIRTLYFIPAMDRRAVPNITLACAEAQNGEGLAGKANAPDPTDSRGGMGLGFFPKARSLKPASRTAGTKTLRSLVLRPR